MSNAPSKPVSFSRPKVGYFSNRPRTLTRTWAGQLMNQFPAGVTVLFCPTKCSYPGSKAAGARSWPLTPSSAEVKNAYSCTSTHSVQLYVHSQCAVVRPLTVCSCMSTHSVQLYAHSQCTAVHPLTVYSCTSTHSVQLYVHLQCTAVQWYSLNELLNIQIYVTFGVFAVVFLKILFVSVVTLRHLVTGSQHSKAMLCPITLTDP